MYENKKYDKNINEKIMEVYTIGYSSFKLEDFIKELHSHGITCVIDVRSTPYSQRYSEYNKEALDLELKKNNIVYRNYANRFGARQENPGFYGKDGILDFKLFIQSDEFQSGIEIIKKGLDLGYTFAFMCAEKDPINCHRSIMVGQGLKNAGFIVKHIKHTGEIETQDELEQRILDMYFKDRWQLSLFSNETENEKELIDKGYELRNKDIGYHLNDIKNKGALI